MVGHSEATSCGTVSSCLGNTSLNFRAGPIMCMFAHAFSDQLFSSIEFNSSKYSIFRTGIAASQDCTRPRERFRQLSGMALQYLPHACSERHNRDTCTSWLYPICWKHWTNSQVPIGDSVGLPREFSAHSRATVRKVLAQNPCSSHVA